MNIIDQIEEEQRSQMAKEVPEFRPGDTLRVAVRVTEGARSRLQPLVALALCLLVAHKETGAH